MRCSPDWRRLIRRSCQFGRHRLDSLGDLLAQFLLTRITMFDDQCLGFNTCSRGWCWWCLKSGARIFKIYRCTQADILTCSADAQIHTLSALSSVSLYATHVCTVRESTRYKKSFNIISPPPGASSPAVVSPTASTGTQVKPHDTE